RSSASSSCARGAGDDRKNAALAGAARRSPELERRDLLRAVFSLTWLASGTARSSVGRTSGPSRQPATSLHLIIAMTRRSPGAAPLRGVHVLLVCDDIERCELFAQALTYAGAL